jgi:hypothetical protein
MENLNLFNKIISSSGSFVLFIFLVVIVFVSITSIILFFHWKKYAVSGAVFATIETIYLSVLVVLISVAFFSLL